MILNTTLVERPGSQVDQLPVGQLDHAAGPRRRPGRGCRAGPPRGRPVARCWPPRRWPGRRRRAPAACRGSARARSRRTSCRPARSPATARGGPGREKKRPKLASRDRPSRRPVGRSAMPVTPGRASRGRPIGSRPPGDSVPTRTSASAGPPCDPGCQATSTASASWRTGRSSSGRPVTTTTTSGLPSAASSRSRSS